MRRALAHALVAAALVAALPAHAGKKKHHRKKHHAAGVELVPDQPALDLAPDLSAAPPQPAPPAARVPASSSQEGVPDVPAAADEPVAPPAATAVDSPRPAAEGADAGIGAAPPPTFRRRFDPGLGVWALADARQYERLVGTATAAGVGVGYSWDLVSLDAEVLQGLVYAAEHRPTYAKLDARWAFFTLGGFSGLGQLALDVVFNGPDRQSDPSHGPTYGPELGLGVRYRIGARADVFAGASAALLTPTSFSRRFFFDPGASAGIAFYPFPPED